MQIHFLQNETSISTYNISIYTLSDLGVLSNLIGSLSLANGHYYSNFIHCTNSDFLIG